MPRVSKLPRGLLSLLGLQNFGENPSELAMSIAPVIGLDEFFMADGQTVEGATGVAIAQGFNTLVTVPAGEIWRVSQLSAIVVTGVGVTVGAFAPSVRVGSLRTHFAPGVAIAASQTRWNSSPFTSPLYLPSGAEFGVEADTVVGATTAFGVTLLVTKLRA